MKNTPIFLVLPLLSVTAAVNSAPLSPENMPYEFVPGMDMHYARNDVAVFQWTCSSAPQLTSRRCWQSLADVDPRSFAPASFIASNAGTAVASRYSKDQRGVYYDGKRIHADPNSFNILGAEWATTPQGVMYAGVPRPEIDAATLQVLDHGWARDKNAVYYSDAIVQNADPSSLHVLNAHYAADNAHVFSGVTPITTSRGPVDMASFQALGDTGYAKDARFVYHDGRRIDAESASFILIDNEHSDCYARDAHRVYYCGKPVALGDAESFVVLDSFFAIDNERVYFDGAPVAAADRGTFRNFQPEDAPPTQVRANAEDERNWYEVVASDLVVTPKDPDARTR